MEVAVVAVVAAVTVVISLYLSVYFVSSFIMIQTMFGLSRLLPFKYKYK